VIHIIEGPKASILPWRQGRVATRARFLGIGAKIKATVGGIIVECPSFKPASRKGTKRKVEWVKTEGMRRILLEETRVDGEEGQSAYSDLELGV
jgi:hypothetical protein